MTEPPGFLELSVGAFLEQVKDRSPAPGGGAVAAVVAALAASLCAMAGRFSEPPDADPSPLVRRALALADAGPPLAQADAAAYGRFLEARRLPRQPDPEARRQAIAEATAQAAEVPLQVARLAAEVAELGATIAAGGNPNLRGDAVTAALLGAAAARAAAALVAINLAGGDDPRVEESARVAAAAVEASRRAAAPR